MLERHGKSNPIFGDRLHIKSWFSLYGFCFSPECLRMFLNCAFYAFYKENQGLEVPRETRLEKLMRLLELSKKCMEGKPSCQQEPFPGCIFGVSRKWKKSR